MPACPYLSTSGYKNPYHTFHISIELLLMFLIYKSLNLIFSHQYFQVLLSEVMLEMLEKLEMLEISNQRENEK